VRWGWAGEVGCGGVGWGRWDGVVLGRVGWGGSGKIGWPSLVYLEQPTDARRSTGTPACRESQESCSVHEEHAALRVVEGITIEVLAVYGYLMRLVQE